MGFWSKLLGKKDAKFDPFAVDADGDGKVQDGTIWERPAALTVDLDKTLEAAEALLQEVAPNKELVVDPELEKKRKRQEAAKKAAATRAANKAKAATLEQKVEKLVDAHAKADAKSKKTQPKKK